MIEMSNRRRTWIAAIGSTAMMWASIIGGDAMAAEGLKTLRSMHGPSETMARLKEAVEAGGMTVFAQIDHAAGAERIGLPLRPTNLLIFGSPKGGTPMMQSAQTSGIDLPLKALVWEDSAGTTWLSYETPTWIAARHDARSTGAIQAMTTAIDAVVTAATSSSLSR
ncbi:MAG: DUF302 domain-containing protein [Bradyrhizobium sp.]